VSSITCSVSNKRADRIGVKVMHDIGAGLVMNPSVESNVNLDQYPCSFHSV